MNSPEKGQPYPYIPEVKDFYRVIYLKDSYPDLLVAAQDFVEATRFIPTRIEREDFLRRESFEPKTSSEDDEALMHDHFLALPLKLLEERGQYSERLTKIGDLGKWYEEVTEFILDRVRDHGLHCLQTDDTTSDCTHSSFCPVKYAAAVLSDDIFEDPTYDLKFMMYDHPHQRRDVVLRKLDIAARQQLIDVTHYDEWVADYDRIYQELYPDTSFQA